jgi:DNA-binding response OmpR family regulator
MNNKIIFVIDDDHDLRESIIEILEASGFMAVGCETAEIAQQKLKERTPDLVILDNMMPGMGGMSFIPILKKSCSTVKIVMITAFSTVDNAVTAMKLGADDYLAKPFKRDELLMTVRFNLEALKIEQQFADPGMDDALACLSNQIRRQILATLASKGNMRFMDITRHLGISDHTKVNFHLKNLKNHHLIIQDREKTYLLTPQGEKMVDCLSLLSQRISE